MEETVNATVHDPARFLAPMHESICAMPAVGQCPGAIDSPAKSTLTSGSRRQSFRWPAIFAHGVIRRSTRFGTNQSIAN